MMKIEKNELIESIKNLNRKKPLKEQKEIQRVLPPADADAQEQHQQALEQNAKRRDPKNYEKEVKELIEETASEDSRYRHFDVVDRRDLAKRINEAKQKGLDFKVSKSNKDGFRYELAVLKEEFIKKEAGDPEVNVQAFNNATNVGASSPMTGLGEDMEEEPIEQCSVCDSIKFLIDDEKEAIDGYKKADECLKSLDDEELKVKISSLYNHIIGEELEHIRELQEMLDKVDPTCSKKLTVDLHEELSPRPRVNGEQLAYDLVSWISDYEGDVLDDVVQYLERLGYEERVINGLFFRGDTLIENIESSNVDEDDLHEDVNWLDLKRNVDKSKVDNIINEFKNILPEGSIELFNKHYRSDGLKLNFEVLIGDDDYDKLKEYANKHGFKGRKMTLKEIDRGIEFYTYLYQLTVPYTYVNKDDLHEELDDDVYDYEDDLDEELKVYTSSLSNFHPSAQAKDLWDEIKANHKEEDLAYMLETLYPDGISDVALDDLLRYEEDWIRDLIDLPLEDEETEDSITDEDETLDDLDDEDIEPLDAESDIESEDDIEPIEYAEDEESEVEGEPEKDTSEEHESKESDEDIEEDDDDKVSDIAEGFIKNNFKANTLNENTTVEETVKKAVCESSEDEEEIVDVSDEVVEGMMGLPTSKKGK